MKDNPSEQVASDEAANSIETVAISVGKVLRETRANLGLSIGDVSHRIKFAPRQIEALEADDFENLPETSFVRGFVRSYARLLQLDPAPLLAALPIAPEQFVNPQANAITDVPFPDSYTERKQNILWLAGALVVVFALAVTAWLLADKPKEPRLPEANLTAHPSATVETITLPISAVSEAQLDNSIPKEDKAIVEKLNVVQPATESIKKASAISSTQADPLPAKTIAVQPLRASEAQPNKSIETPPAQKMNLLADASRPSGANLVRMTFDADSWVEIKDKNGKLLLSKIQQAGVEQKIVGMPPLSLVIGNAKSVHVFYKGQVVDLAPHINIEVARLTLE